MAASTRHAAVDTDFVVRATRDMRPGMIEQAPRENCTRRSASWLWNGMFGRPAVVERNAAAAWRAFTSRALSGCPRRARGSGESGSQDRSRQRRAEEGWRRSASDGDQEASRNKW